MKKLMYFAVFCLTALIIVSFFSCAAKSPQANLKTDIDSLAYAYGVSYGQGLGGYLTERGYEGAVLEEFFKNFLESSKIKKGDKKALARAEGKMIGSQVIDLYDNINTNLFGYDSTAVESMSKSEFLAGFLAAAQNKNLRIEIEMAQMYVQMKGEEIQNRANAKTYEAVKIESIAFMESNKTQAGVKVLPSGLQYKVEKEGRGPKPTAEDVVKVNYRGADIYGQEFESNNEVVFGLGGVIPGWTEGIQLMTVGSKYTLYIPYDLAYGESGRLPNIKPFAALIFDVELLEIVK